MKGGQSYDVLVQTLGGQFSKGYLSAVIRGTRPASAKLQRALGLRPAYKPHPVMRRSKINRAIKRPVVIKGDSSGVCATVGDHTYCAATMADLIEWLASQ